MRSGTEGAFWYTLVIPAFLDTGAGGPQVRAHPGQFIEIVSKFKGLAMWLSGGALPSPIPSTWRQSLAVNSPSTRSFPAYLERSPVHLFLIFNFSMGRVVDLKTLELGLAWVMATILVLS